MTDSCPFLVGAGSVRRPQDGAWRGDHTEEDSNWRTSSTGIKRVVGAFLPKLASCSRRTEFIPFQKLKMSPLIKPRASEDDTVGTDLPSRLPWLRVLVKVVVVASFFGLWVWAYDAVNTFSANPVRTIHLTSPATVFPWIIQPWTAVIYILGGVVFPSAPFLYYRTWRGILFVMACFTASSLFAFAIYGRGQSRWSAPSIWVARSVSG